VKLRRSLSNEALRRRSPRLNSGNLDGSSGGLVEGRQILSILFRSYLGDIASGIAPSSVSSGVGECSPCPSLLFVQLCTYAMYVGVFADHKGTLFFWKVFGRVVAKRDCEWMM
jgi:hypothetical protein